MTEIRACVVRIAGKDLTPLTAKVRKGYAKEAKKRTRCSLRTSRRFLECFAVKSFSLLSQPGILTRYLGESTCAVCKANEC